MAAIRTTLSRFACIAALISAAGGCATAPQPAGAPVSASRQGSSSEHVFVVSSRAPAEDRAELFSSEGASSLHFADIAVSIPDDRQPGEIVYPKRQPDREKEFVAANIRLTDDEALFTQRLRAELARWPEDQRTIFIYVHGYNTSFAEGLFRSAQLVHDYDFPGATLHYTWPSAGNPLQYWKDRHSAERAGDGLVRTLRITAKARPRNIVLLAHSMGAAIAMEVVSDLAQTGDADIVRRIDALTLASPDIDARQFTRQVSAMPARPKVIAVITSGRDRALRVSSIINGGRLRAGTGAVDAQLRALGVVVIDASDFGGEKDPARHRAFANSPAMLRLMTDANLPAAGLSPIIRLKKRLTGG